MLATDTMNADALRILLPAEDELAAYEAAAELAEAEAERAMAEAAADAEMAAFRAACDLAAEVSPWPSAEEVTAWEAGMLEDEEFARWTEYVRGLPTPEEVAAEAARLGEGVPF